MVWLPAQTHRELPSAMTALPAKLPPTWTKSQEVPSFWQLRHRRRKAPKGTFSLLFRSSQGRGRKECATEQSRNQGAEPKLIMNCSLSIEWGTADTSWRDFRNVWTSDCQAPQSLPIPTARLLPSSWLCPPGVWVGLVFALQGPLGQEDTYPNLTEITQEGVNVSAGPTDVNDGGVASILYPSLHLSGLCHVTL